MIEIKDLTKTYGSLQVLRGITTKINEGEQIAIIGPSGGGKSTFLRCLNCLEEPTAGSIVFDGEELTSPKNDINKSRQKIGMVDRQ